MGELFIEHRDPLFGIIILILLIAVIFLVTYFWNLRAQRRREQSLKKFSQLFDHSSVDKDAKALFERGADFGATLGFLAETYSKAGEYDKAIKIYLAMLEQTQESGEKLLLLESLGETYFKAGFLERAKKIFLEVLKNAPRNPKALFWLMQACENLGQFDEALEALDCLLELGEKSERVKFNHAYLSAKRVLADPFLPLESKREELLELLQNEPRLFRVVLGHLKSFELPLFWKKIVGSDYSLEVMDWLWNIPWESIPFDIISKDKNLMDIYRAKGYVKDAEACEKFELEVLRVMNLYSSKKADLSFEYRCHACKSLFPVEFERCPSCGELLSGSLILKIRKSRNETNLSFL